MTKYSTLFITKNGVPETGLSPQFDIYKDIITGNDVIPAPSIDEIGGGLYRIIDTEINFGSRNIGRIDAGNTITQPTERYIPYFGSFEEVGTQIEVVVSAALDEPNQSMLLSTYMEQNGQIQLNNLSSASIQFYDFNHNLLFTVGGSSAMNGVFILSQSTISLTLVANRPYYALSTITLDTGEAFSSVDTLITLS